MRPILGSVQGFRLFAIPADQWVPAMIAEMINELIALDAINYY
jgi:hypothetical protein